MSTVARVIQAVKAHIPSIKFPSRNMGEVFRSSSGPAMATATPMQPSPSSGPVVQSAPVRTTPRGSGIDEASLPQRYHRKPISLEEMAYIERGGPE